MSSANSVNARKCVHAQKQYFFSGIRRMNQTRSEEEEKERKRDKKDRCQKYAEKKAAQHN